MLFSHSPFIYQIVSGATGKWEEVLASKKSDVNGKILNDYWTGLRDHIPALCEETKEGKEHIVGEYFDDVWWLAAKPYPGAKPQLYSNEEDFPELRDIGIDTIQNGEMLLGFCSHDIVKAGQLHATVYLPLKAGVVEIKRWEKISIKKDWLHKRAYEYGDFEKCIAEVRDTTHCTRLHMQVLKGLLNEMEAYIRRNQIPVSAIL